MNAHQAVTSVISFVLSLSQVSLMLTLNTQCFLSDVDECIPSLNVCDQLCTNTQGSYECSCMAGYELYKSAGFNDLELYDGENGNAPWHTFYIDHSCVCKYPYVMESIM